MSNQNNKEKRIPKTKEQISEDIKKQEEVKRFRQKVKQELYPLLLKESESIEDAKMMLQVVKLTIQQSVLQKQKGIKLRELEIPRITEEKFERYNKFMDLLMEENVSVSMELCEGLSNVIDSFIKEENSKRKLTELPATLLD